MSIWEKAAIAVIVVFLAVAAFLLYAERAFRHRQDMLRYGCEVGAEYITPDGRVFSCLESGWQER